MRGYETPVSGYEQPARGAEEDDVQYAIATDDDTGYVTVRRHAADAAEEDRDHPYAIASYVPSDDNADSKSEHPYAVASDIDSKGYAYPQGLGGGVQSRSLAEDSKGYAYPRAVVDGKGYAYPQLKTATMGSATSRDADGYALPRHNSASSSSFSSSPSAANRNSGFYSALASGADGQQQKQQQQQQQQQDGFYSVLGSDAQQGSGLKRNSGFYSALAPSDSVYAYTNASAGETSTDADVYAIPIAKDGDVDA